MFKLPFNRLTARHALRGVKRALPQSHRSFARTWSEGLGNGAMCSRFSTEAGGGGKTDQERRKEELLGKIQKLKQQTWFTQLGLVNESEDLKLFETSHELIPKTEAIKFPFLEASSLGDKIYEIPSSDAVSLVMISANKVGGEMAETWRSPVERHVLENKGQVQIVHLSVLQHWMFRMLAPFVKAGMEKELDPDNINSTVLISTPFDSWYDALGITTYVIPHVFLVDSEGYVRWKACGECSTFEESMSIINNLQALIDEHTKASSSSFASSDTTSSSNSRSETRRKKRDQGGA